MRARAAAGPVVIVNGASLSELIGEKGELGVGSEVADGAGAGFVAAEP
jgi:hypothetical protein